MEKKKVIIFGGTGFIGTRLANYLLQSNYEPVIVARHSPSKKNLHRFVVSILAQMTN